MFHTKWFVTVTFCRQTSGLLLYFSWLLAHQTVAFQIFAHRTVDPLHEHGHLSTWQLSLHWNMHICLPDSCPFTGTCTFVYLTVVPSLEHAHLSTSFVTWQLSLHWNMDTPDSCPFTGTWTFVYLTVVPSLEHGHLPMVDICLTCPFTRHLSHSLHWNCTLWLPLELSHVPSLEHICHWQLHACTHVCFHARHTFTLPLPLSHTHTRTHARMHARTHTHTHAHTLTNTCRERRKSHVQV